MSRQIRINPITFHGGIATLVVLVLTILLLLALRVPLYWYWFLACWLLAINVTAFAYYGFDKYQARAQSRRIPEAVLHGLAVAGGTLGAYAGMVVFRHKTIKSNFRIIFWLIVVVQVLLILAVIYRIWKNSA